MLCALLCGCLGGTVAQQIARSIATSVADKAVAKAMDVDESPNSANSATNTDAKSASVIENPFDTKPRVDITPKTAAEIYPQLPKAASIETLAARSRAPSQDEIDEFNERYVFATSGFKPVETPPEGQPDTANTKAAVQQPKTPEIAAESRPLVRVEVLNLLVGDEKQSVYEKARLLGALNLPLAREWPRWYVATGRIDNGNKLITFLIPPDVGKPKSGAKAVVELAGTGDLNIARYQEN